MRKLLLLLLSLVLAVVVAAPVLAAGLYSSDITVSDNSSVDRTGVGTLVPYGASQAVSFGYLTANGTDTRMFEGTTPRDYMVASDRLGVLSPELLADQERLYRFETSYSPPNDFGVVVGSGGYVTVAHDASIELGDNFTIEQKGWVDTTPEGGSKTLNLQVESNTDDCLVYWDGGNWVFNHTADNQMAGYYGAAVLKIGGGMVFGDVIIPQGSTIVSANLVLTSSGDSATDNVSSIIIGEATDNASTFSDLANYQARRGTIVDGANDNNITTASVDWTPVEHWLVGEEYTSPDISAIIQEIVDREGWGYGNSLAIHWDDFDDRSTHEADLRRLANAHNFDDATAPKLQIEYAVGFLVEKEGAIIVYVNTSGNVTAEIVGGPSVTATGVSSGEYTIKTTQQAVLSFDGVANKVDCGSDAVFNITDNITLMAWAYHDNVGSEFIVGKYQSDTAYALYTGATNKLTFDIHVSNASKTVVSTDSIGAGSWAFYAATYDRVNMNIYVNGELNCTPTAETGAIDVTAESVRIGHGISDTYGWEGLIGEVWIYARTFTPQEIREYYNGVYSDTTGLVGYWKLDEGSGATVYDSAGDNDGTIAGATWGSEILRLYVDNSLGDVDVGADVPGNSADWVFLQNDVMPYSDNISISVNGTLALWFRPNYIIESTREEGTADGGTATSLWDSILDQGDDYWDLARLIITSTTDGNAPQGQNAVITSFDAASDNLTFGALTAAVGAGDNYTVVFAMLPDREGDNDGRITWGVNEDVVVGVGGLASLASYTSTPAEGEDPPTVLPLPGDVDMWGDETDVSVDWLPPELVGPASTGTPVYDTGDVSGAEDSDTITGGGGTAWDSDWDGYTIVIDGDIYVIESVDGPADITLTTDLTEDYTADSYVISTPSLGWSINTLYGVLMLFVAMGVGVGVAIATGSALLAAIAVGVGLAVAASSGAVGWWVLLVFSIFGAAYLVASRSM